MSENPNQISTPDDMSTMVNVLARLTKEGYTTQFKANESSIVSTRTQKSYRPSEVRVKHFYRFEGVSDPDDMSIVYAIECGGGEKGTLIDSYGTYSDPHIEKFIKQVEAISK